MFSPKTNRMIAAKVQQVLEDIKSSENAEGSELPRGEINFLLHVDGAEHWSWANIHNNYGNDTTVPTSLIMNRSI